MEAPAEQPPTPGKRARRRRTDDQRLAELQRQLAKLNQTSAKERRPAPVRRALRVEPDGDPIDAELRDLVESFVGALREVIRRKLVAQATKRLS